MQNTIQSILPTEIALLIFSLVEKTEANLVCKAWHKAIAAIRMPHLIDEIKRFNFARRLMLGERPERAFLEGFENVDRLYHQILTEDKALDEDPENVLRVICERETNLNLYLLFDQIFGYHPVKPQGFWRKVSTTFGGSPIDKSTLADPKILAKTIEDNRDSLAAREMIDIYYDLLPQYCTSHLFFPREFGLFKNLKSLRIRVISGKPFRLHLRSIPHQIFSFTKLEHLVLQFHKFPKVSESLGNLVALKSLQLRSNQIEQLPASISNLVNLQHLDLEENRLTTLPAEIGALPELTVVCLSYNQLTALPEEMGACSKLKFLKLYRNQLITVPESFSRLTELVGLNLWDNPIKTIPEVFDSVKYIFLSHIDDLSVSEEYKAIIREKNDRIFNEDKTYDWWDYTVYEEGDPP